MQTCKSTGYQFTEERCLFFIFIGRKEERRSRASQNHVMGHQRFYLCRLVQHELRFDRGLTVFQDEKLPFLKEDKVFDIMFLIGGIHNT